MLQNWWRKKPFVEVDAAYLDACEATVHFLITPQTAIPEVFDVNASDHVEVELLDAGECEEELEDAA